VEVIETALPIKYGPGMSTGVSFEVGETRTVQVTAESLDKPSAYKGDSVTYTATVLDNTAAKLPATFLVDLEINGTKVITGKALAADVYSQTTGLLTLAWTVPDIVGVKTVKLVWAEQAI